MRAYLERRTSRAAGWCRRAAVFSAVLFVTAGLCHRYGLLETPAFLWVLVIVAALAIAALLLAAVSFRKVWNDGDRGGGDLTLGIVIALLVLVPFLISAYRGAVNPELHDVSTDLDDPPALAVAARMRTPDMNPLVPATPEQRKLQAQKFPQVTGRRYELAFDRTFDAVMALMERRGWKPIGPWLEAGGQSEITIDTVAYTTILAFPVDVAIRLINEGDTTYVDMRSASRYGRHDLGDNAARIVDFLAELDTEVAAQAGAVPAEEAPEE
ncbi:DUF1499 domain-containing protein [Pseudaminobacter arsenicus]|uniref:DUF1499 domain-containing protein n=1 Tax=Borborobacter arsenicus TaxID=1851146 RepID=A0A432V4W3_9HYPH|nr:DUF1499 domain-containing protein [Pseudaminobacter arsenicus]RUM97198.1 DUF1499 domain-containing protein [Pseudaminobacter arsenicus]